MESSHHDHQDGVPRSADEAAGMGGLPGGRWYRSVVENSTEIVSVVDPDGTLKYASPAWKRVLGYDPEEVLSTNVFERVHPEDLPRVLERTREALAEGGVATNRAEYRFRHKDGSWRHLESVGTYLLDDPEVRGVVITSGDVTERKKTEEALALRERRYATLLSNEPALVYRCLNAPDWPMVFVSDYGPGSGTRSTLASRPWRCA